MKIIVEDVVRIVMKDHELCRTYSVREMTIYSKQGIFTVRMLADNSKALKIKRGRNDD